jgi:hypothetical protein
MQFDGSTSSPPRWMQTRRRPATGMACCASRSPDWIDAAGDASWRQAAEPAGHILQENLNATPRRRGGTPVHIPMAACAFQPASVLTGLAQGLPVRALKFRAEPVQR